jgi:hypothetical protein
MAALKTWLVSRSSSLVQLLPTSPEHTFPLMVVPSYLETLWVEAATRGYKANLLIHSKVKVCT